MPRLYEIASAYAQLEQLLDDPTMDERQVVEWLDECKTDLQEKATNTIMLVQNLEATAKAIKEAESQMAERRRAIENRAKSIKAYVLSNMQAHDIQKIECSLFRISRRKNPPSVVIDDEAAIPIAYLRQPEPPPPSPDKKAILEEIKNGVIIDGAHVEQSERLVIG